MADISTHGVHIYTIKFEDVRSMCTPKSGLYTGWSYSHQIIAGILTHHRHGQNGHGFKSRLCSRVSTGGRGPGYCDPQRFSGLLGRWMCRICGIGGICGICLKRSIKWRMNWSKDVHIALTLHNGEKMRKTVFKQKSSSHRTMR